MGLTISYFYSLTPREFDNISEGYFRKQEGIIKRQMILNRDLEFAIISPHLSEKHKNLTAERYKPFSWERKVLGFNSGKRRTKAELSAMIAGTDIKDKV